MTITPACGRWQGDDRIVFIGAVKGNTIAELYSNAYLFTLPSNLEGMANTLLESMSYGCCCLVSDIAENTEVVGDKTVTFPKGNVEALTEKLQWLLHDAAAVAGYSAQAADYILDKYNWDLVVAQMLRVYRGERVEYSEVWRQSHGEAQP